MNLRRVIPAAAFLLALCVAPARADFAAGVQAYDGGDYEMAFAEWRQLARAGDPMAQTAIASMYRFGEGRPANPVRAARWYRRAAKKGAVIAQLNLGEMYMLGIGVERDAVRAHLWLSLAAQGGNGWARETRDMLARRMSPTEIARARALIPAGKAQ